MPDAVANDPELLPPIDQWLLPLGTEDSCGPDLEYDPESLELAISAGKPDSQFGKGEPANWGRVRELAESLFGRTRDLRVAMWWGRARLNLDGFEALPAVLQLLYGLLDRFWDELHPRPDPESLDVLARVSVVGGLDKLDSLLGDLRNSRLSTDRRLDGVRVRDVEVALSKLAPRPEDPAPRSQGQIAGTLADATDLAASLRLQIDDAKATLDRLQGLMGQRFSSDMVVDLKALRGMLASVESVLPEGAEEPALVEAAGVPVAMVPPRKLGGVYSVDNRQDAIRAIELVCDYLERSEPTNPAQMLLRRAARMIDKNFLQLVRELAPDAVKEVARVMGVDPKTVDDNN
jgi:type VI secretion system protein ImpA